MVVKHILKDGKVLTDISGHVVKSKEAEAVYTLLNKIRKGRKNEHHI